MADRLLAEVRRSLEFYTTQEGGSPIEKIILTGGGSRLKGLAEYLQTRLGVSVTRRETFSSIPLPDGDYGPEFDSVIGLALNSHNLGAVPINLVPSDIYLRRRAETSQRNSRIAMVLFVILLAETLAWGWFKYDARRRALDGLRDLQSQPVEIPGQGPLIVDGRPIAHQEVLDMLADLQAERDRVEDRLATIRALEYEKKDWLAVLLEIEEILPPKTWIVGSGELGRGFSLGGPTIGIQVRTFEEREVRTFLDNVDRSPYFNFAGSNFSTTVTDVNGQSAWEFNITLDVIFPEAPEEAPDGT